MGKSDGIRDRACSGWCIKAWHKASEYWQ